MRMAAPRKILAIDVGGTHVKVLATGRRKPLEIPSGPKMTAKQMVRDVREGTAGWRYSVVSIGYPGPVLHGKPVSEPANLGGGWVGFDYAKAFGHPVPRQLQEWTHALSGPGNRPRFCSHRRRRARTDGTGAPAIQEREDVRRSGRQRGTTA